jgi:hypothetical protein
MHPVGYHEARQYAPQPSQHMAHPAHPSQRPVFQREPANRPSEAAPAFSSRRIPAPADSRVAPASTRLPTRERASASTFPAFDTDWDIPAFQRKGQ